MTLPLCALLTRALVYPSLNIPGEAGSNRSSFHRLCYFLQACQFPLQHISPSNTLGHFFYYCFWGPYLVVLGSTKRLPWPVPCKACIPPSLSGSFIAWPSSAGGHSGNTWSPQWYRPDRFGFSGIIKVTSDNAMGPPE